MATEIERKFLVTEADWRHGARRSYRIEQAYLHTDPDRTVRVRCVEDRGVLTIKGRAQNLVRDEFEYDIPPADARAMVEDFRRGHVVEKTRWEVISGAHLWEVDEFHGANRGLVVAEIELETPDEAFDLPEWIGREVTGEVRYYNARLAEHPYREWSEEQR